MKKKYDEMYVVYHETEKVINQRVSKVERNLHMKEEEVVRLKQILYGKEDVIRKVSIAYEQAKNDLEDYIEQIDIFKAKINEYETLDHNELITQNRNLKTQNKQLLMALMNHLTQPRSRKSSKKKKSRFSGTLISNPEFRKRGALDHSVKHKSQQKRKKTSHRKHSSKRGQKAAGLNNFSSLLDNRNVPSLRSVNKKLINVQNSQLANNYQSFDNTLNKAAMMDHLASSVKNSTSVDFYSDGFRALHHQSVKTPQGDISTHLRQRSKNRPKTAVRREKEIRQREDIHSASQQVPYEHVFGHEDDFSHNELEQFKEDIRNGNIELVDDIDPQTMEMYDHEEDD